MVRMQEETSEVNQAREVVDLDMLEFVAVENEALEASQRLERTMRQPLQTVTTKFKLAQRL